MKDGDLSWRMLHGVVATGSLLSKMKVLEDELCLFCFSNDNLKHIFYDCPRLRGLFIFLDSLISNFFPEVKSCPRAWWFSGIPSLYGSSSDIGKLRIVNWLLVLARKSIYVSRSNKINDELPDGVLYIFKSKIRHRLSIEFQYAKYTEELTKFIKYWCLSSLKCYIVDNEKISYDW